MVRHSHAFEMFPAYLTRPRLVRIEGIYGWLHEDVAAIRSGTEGDRAERGRRREASQGLQALTMRCNVQGGSIQCMLAMHHNLHR